MYCRFCGKQILDDSVFCRYCGKNQGASVGAFSSSPSDDDYDFDLDEFFSDAVNQKRTEEEIEKMFDIQDGVLVRFKDPQPNVSDVVIPDGVTTIGEGAFQFCRNLTTVEIPEGVTTIQKNAFQCCIKLGVVQLPKSLLYIDEYAFYCCNIRSLKIPEGVLHICDNAFIGNERLCSITVVAGNSVYHSQNHCLIETHSQTLVLGCCNSMIPANGSVTSIGKNAFNSCHDLVTVTIPDSVVSIGENAFLKTGLSCIRIPQSVQSIGMDAFGDCEDLYTIQVPRHTVIGRDAFAGCFGRVTRY